MNTKQKSIQSTTMTKTFSEQVNLPRAQWLLTHSSARLRTMFWSEDELNGAGATWDYKPYMASVRYFLNECIKQEGKTIKKYKHSVGCEFGRLYVSSFGIQSLQSRLRNFLVAGSARDYDIVNAHFSILLNLVQKYNKNANTPLEIYHLSRYVKNRDKILRKYHFDKKMALIILNSDKLTTNYRDKIGVFTKIEFLRDLHEELTTIKQTWFDQDCYDKYKGGSNVVNPLSSFLNKILCDSEATYLQKVINTLNLGNDCHTVPMFDGFLTDKMIDIDSINDMCKEPDDTIHSIKWVEKPVNDPLNMTDAEITEEIAQSRLYCNVKDSYEATRVYIKDTSTYQYSHRTGDPSGAMIWLPANRKAMEADSETIKVINEHGKTVPIFPIWAADPLKRQYDTLDFVPFTVGREADVPNWVFNTFIKFSWKKTDIILERDPVLYDYLFNVIADGNAEIYTYIRMKIAHIIQFPNENPRVATIINGVQGSGKDTLGYIIGKLISKNYVAITTKIEDILPKNGCFNTMLRNKIVVEFNESTGADGCRYIEQLKDFVTRETNDIRELYRESYSQKNIARMFVFSNNLNPIQMTEGQRRFVWIKMNKKKKPQEYFQNLYNHIHSAEWIEKIGNELLREEGVAEYFKKKTYPITEVMKEYTDLNRPLTTQFVYYSVLHGELFPLKDSEDEIDIETIDLFSSYMAFRKERNMSEDKGGSFTSFSKHMLNFDGICRKKVNFRRANGTWTTKRMFRISLKELAAEVDPLFAEDGDSDIDSDDDIIMD